MRLATCQLTANHRTDVCVNRSRICLILLLNLALHHNDGLQHQRTKGFLVVVDGKDVCLGDDQRTARADDLASGDQLFPSAGATRFSLYSTVRTEASAGATVIAA